MGKSDLFIAYDLNTIINVVYVHREVNYLKKKKILLAFSIKTILFKLFNQT